MKRKPLLACLLAAAAPLAAAQSSVTVYGLYDAAVRRADNAGANNASRRSMDDGVFTGTRLGFRGREDMGGGLYALFTLEAGFDPSTGTSLQSSPTADYGQAASTTRFFGREAHVSLRANWGAVTLGRQYTLAHTLAARFQPQGNPNSTAHSLFSSHHLARQDNVARFDTKLGPVDLGVMRTFGEQTLSSSANGAWALGAGYAAGAVSLGIYAQQLKNITGAETRRIVGAGGNVKAGQRIQLYSGWMQRRHAVSVQKNRAWTLGANVQVAPLVLLSVAHYDDRQSGSAALAGSRRVDWVTANYLFSRRTDVYAVLDRNKVRGGYALPAFMGAKGSQDGFAVGLRHRF
jgi:predicted porin